MATSSQRTKFRRRVGDNDVSNRVFSDSEIDDIYTEANEEYPSNSKLEGYYAVIIGLEWLMADAAKLTNYRQNNSSENQSDIFKHLEKLLKNWEGKLESEARRAQTGVRLSRYGPHRINKKRLPK